MARIVPTREPRIVARPTRGLANRLRAITSCQALAEHLGIGAAFHWAPGRGFSEEPWPELFANELALIGPAEYADELRSGRPIADEWLARNESGDRVPFGPWTRRRLLGRIRRRGLVWDEASRNLDRELQERGATGLEPVRELRKVLCRRLRPALRLARVVDAFVGARFAGHEVVGVQIRRGDALASKSPELYRSSTDEAFAAGMDGILADRPDTRFFLATDCEKTQQRFRERYGERLLVHDKPFVASVWGDSKAGQADAVVDLFLLSRTREVLCTRGSTFGRMATLIGGIDFRFVGTPPGD